MSDPADIARTITFSFLFISFAVTVFSKHFLLSAIPGIAAWSYWNMLRHKDSIEFYRYVDWILTTPMMLFAILAANGTQPFIAFSMIILDVLMIGTGYLGATETNKLKQLGLFGLGCLALLPILYTIFKMKKAKNAVYLTLILWTLYPIVWYADEQNLIQNTVANVSYAVMDLVAKVGLVTFLQL
jgi:bacteriorhodopsin